jgi:hypothetical protein
MPGDPATTRESIVAACRKQYDLHYDDCSGFLRAVAAELGFPLAGNADSILDFLDRGWTKIDRTKAIEAVRAGTFVIAGLKSSEHNPPRNNGHVVVVVDGALYNGKYPLVWGGSIGNAQSAGTRSVGEVWRRTDRDAVRYYQPPPGRQAQ